MNNFPLISKYKEKLPAFDFSCACVVLSCTCIGAYAGGRHTKRPLFRRKLTSVTTPWVFPKDLEVFNSTLLLLEDLGFFIVYLNPLMLSGGLNSNRDKDILLNNLLSKACNVDQQKKARITI